MTRSLDLDNRPHSRACGWKKHMHGPDCAIDCPTCHGTPARDKSKYTAIVNLLVDKGLVDGLEELRRIDQATLTEYLAGPFGQEAFNVQQSVIRFNGKSYDFIRGLAIGIASGIILDPNTAGRDLRGALAILANDGVNVMDGSSIETLTPPETEATTDDSNG